MKDAEKKPIKFADKSLLYPSEIHTLCVIANNPGNNITNIAKITGITKGAVSQTIKKLERKKMVQKYHEGSDREVLLKLSASAEKITSDYIKIFTQRECDFMNILSKLENESLLIVNKLFEDFERIIKNYLRK